jgi:hypothetical protein
MAKLSTPDWIKEGYNSKDEYERAHNVKSKKKSEKTFKIRKCPECESSEVNVVLTGEEGKEAREWECKKCKWQGKNIKEEELSEEEFMKYLDENRVEVA